MHLTHETCEHCLGPSLRLQTRIPRMSSQQALSARQKAKATWGSGSSQGFKAALVLPKCCFTVHCLPTRSQCRHPHQKLMKHMFNVLTCAASTQWMSQPDLPVFLAGARSPCVAAVWRHLLLHRGLPRQHLYVLLDPQPHGHRCLSACSINSMSW